MLWSQFSRPGGNDWRDPSSTSAESLCQVPPLGIPGIWFEECFEKWSAGDLKMEMSPPKLALDLLSQSVDDFFWGCLIVSKSTKKKHAQWLQLPILGWTCYSYSMFEWLPVITKYEWGTWVLGMSSCDFLVRWISSQVLGVQGTRGDHRRPIWQAGEQALSPCLRVKLHMVVRFNHV